MSFIWRKYSENQFIQDRFHFKALAQPCQWSDFLATAKQ